MTSTSSNHLECDKQKKNQQQPTHTWTDSQYTHSPRIQLMFSQCRQLWVIPIQQQQEVKTSQGDPLLCSYSWLLALSLFSCWWATTVAMGGAKTDISFAVCSHLISMHQQRHRPRWYASSTFSPSLSFEASSTSLRGHWFSSGEGRCVTLHRLDW